MQKDQTPLEAGHCPNHNPEQSSLEKDPERHPLSALGLKEHSEEDQDSRGQPSTAKPSRSGQAWNPDLRPIDRWAVTEAGVGPTVQGTTECAGRLKVHPRSKEIKTSAFVSDFQQGPSKGSAYPGGGGASSSPGFWDSLFLTQSPEITS